MNKGAKINAFLIGIGFSAEVSYKEAQRLEKMLTKTASPTPAAPLRTRGVHGGGTSYREDIISYGRSRKGNVFSLGSLSAKLGVDANNLSPTITGMVRDGTLNRVGRGEYLLNCR